MFGVNLLKRNLTISGLLLILATLILKFSGLLRDMVLAYYFGDSNEASAYLVAFILPNIFILFFATGMKNSFVPSYILATINNKSEHHFSQIMRVTTIFGLSVTAIGIVFSPIILPRMYPDFNAETIQLTITVATIFFVSITFSAMNSVYEAYLDAESRYSISVFSQTIVITSSILSAILFSQQIGIYAFAYGYLVGAVLSFLMKKFFFIPKNSHTIGGKLDKNEIKPFVMIFIPVGITVMVGQVNLIIDTIFAGQFAEQAVSYLNYAKNIVHFPQAIIGVTIGTIIFPVLSKAVANKDKQQFNRSVEKGLILTLFLILPAIAGMMLLMEELIEIIYQRGAFTAQASSATATVAYFYVGSVLFFSLQNTINKAFYAKQNGHIILRISIFSVFLNIALNFLFIYWLKSYIGIPLASSVMAAVYFGLNIIVYQKTEDRLNWTYLMKSIGKIVLSLALMVAILMLSSTLLKDMHPIVNILSTSIIGAIVYLSSSYILKIDVFSDVVKRFMKRRV
ncbi:murein biosynthesis integral membrane protein MurJ [Paenisporosarcina antarctica]|uniref:Lipid II flippase n=1 Tax=Paenisporosarcina antarctica TaxID=417367 RepID=A0A4P6ZYY8_9BACL|nr:murein biosynthesis integral membrane protein MurJ [Paenisporosarcina antarctica]